MTRPIFGAPTWVPNADFDALPTMYGLLNQPTVEMLFTQQVYRRAGVNYALANYPGWTGTANLSAAGMTVNGAGNVVSLGPFTFPAVGSIYCEYVTPTQTNASRLYPYFVNDSTSGSRFCLRGAESVDPVPDMVIGDGTSNISMTVITATTGQLIKSVLSYDTTSARAGFAANGVDTTQAKQQTAATLTGATLYLGSAGGAGGYLTTAIRRFVIYPSFFTPAQRIAMTQ